MALFNELRELPYGLDGKEVVVQRYLDKPLLLDGFKFDLRVYVVVIGVDEMKAYICDEGLVRFCTVSELLSVVDLVRTAVTSQLQKGIHASD